MAKAVWRFLGTLAVAGALGLAAPAGARAHCDAIDGPVVTAANEALQQGDVTPVLKWIKPEYEEEVRQAFDAARALRSRGSDVRDVAERAFFETLVRLHRAGEGEPYTGLKPEGSQAPVFVALDRALASGSLEEPLAAIMNEVEAGLRQRFTRVREAQRSADDHVEAGRAYVAAYADLLRYADRVYAAATGQPPEHGETR